jgi:hypothetical protein
MTLSTQSTVYRVAINGQECRSAASLLNLNVGELPGVSAVTTTDEGALIVVASSGVDLHDTLVSTVVASGFDPLLVTVAELERAVDPNGLPFDQALRLGLVEAPKPPVRAAVVQRLSVQVTDGYEPDTILVDAGVPVELAFSEGHGCLGRVVFGSLGIEADLETGGAIVQLPALTAGTYPFSCGRGLVHGTLIAE